jgi:HD-like signal output (HDOD) protein
MASSMVAGVPIARLMTPAADLVLTRDDILAFAQSLPAAPQILGGLCELLEDVNTDLDQISGEIRRDPVLAGRVIRLSNSVAFGGGGGVSSIDGAVNRVGFAEIIRLVGIATVAGLVDRSLVSYGVGADRLRESLLLHALASEAIAAQTSLDPRAGYAAGLLRGIGMMVLDRASRGRVAYDASAFQTYSQWEEICFNVRAAAVTTAVLDEWRFPAETVAALEQHLAPADSQLAHVLNLAGAVVTTHGLALAGEKASWDIAPEKFAGAGLEEAQYEEAAGQAIAAFERQRSALY